MRVIEKIEVSKLKYGCVVVTQNFLFNYSLFKIILNPSKKVEFSSENQKDMSVDGTGLRVCIIPFAENTALYTKASQVFTEADKNGSGELSPDELKVFIKKLTNIDVDKILNPYEQMEMFSDLDEDHDGKLAKKGILKLYKTAQT